jgi:hypothetical protein
MALPRNNARSGGPSTSRGIALASQNSLTTGVYSAQVILPGEDADAFEALRQDLISDFRPRNSLEQSLVQDVAVLMWKKQRIESIEQRILREAFQRLVDELPLDAIFDGERYPAPLPVHIWDGLKLTASQVAAYKAIIPQIQEFLDKRSRKQYAYAVSPDSALFAELNALAAEKGLTAAELLADGRTKSAPLYDVLDEVLGLLLEKALCYMLIASKKAELGAALMSGWTSTMTAVFYGDKNRRAAEDNSRAIYRTLAELRKMQSRRQYVEARDIEDLQTIKDA